MSTFEPLPRGHTTGRLAPVTKLLSSMKKIYVTSLTLNVTVKGLRKNDDPEKKV